MCGETQSPMMVEAWYQKRFTAIVTTHVAIFEYTKSCDQLKH